MIDGSKRPLVNWKKYQSASATPDQIRTMFSENAGIAIVAGSVSGNLEVLDFEDNACVLCFEILDS